MNPNDIRNVALAAAGVASFGFATVTTLKKIRRNEVAKRESLQTEAQLDAEAIQIAAKIITGRWVCGEFRKTDEVMRAYRNEIEFQKIAIRES